MGEVQERAEGDLTLAGGVPLPQTGLSLWSGDAESRTPDGQRAPDPREY